MFEIIDYITAPFTSRNRGVEAAPLSPEQMVDSRVHIIDIAPDVLMNAPASPNSSHPVAVRRAAEQVGRMAQFTRPESPSLNFDNPSGFNAEPKTKMVAPQMPTLETAPVAEGDQSLTDVRSNLASLYEEQGPTSVPGDFLAGV